MKKSKITVICYGEREEWDNRDEAIYHYKECVANSDGAERDRYVNILIDLLDGLVLCSDGEDL